jgi:ABC-2 type transport system ATP-binding protein
MLMGNEQVIVVENVAKSYRVAVPPEGRFSTIRGLVRPTYRITSAVTDLSFGVKQGETVGLLGPNGAGKSTTIKLLTGVLTPDSGAVLIHGAAPNLRDPRIGNQIGVVFGQRTQLWWDLPARDSFSILRSIYDIPEQRFRNQLSRFDELLELSSFWHTPVRQLSLGQRVRCDLAAALLHDPAMVLLDEPTIGMDVVAREQVRMFLRQSATEDGKTILLTTHEMTDVERLCERVLLIGGGRLVHDGSLADFKDRTTGGDTVLRVTFVDPPAHVEVPGAAVTHVQGGVVRLRLDAGIDVHRVVREVSARYEIVGISQESQPLEDIVRDFYQRDDFRTAPAGDRD